MNEEQRLEAECRAADAELRQQRRILEKMQIITQRRALTYKSWQWTARIASTEPLKWAASPVGGTEKEALTALWERYPEAKEEAVISTDPEQPYQDPKPDYSRHSKWDWDPGYGPSW